MRINILQHTPNEGPGAIQTWSQQHHHDLYVYHPAQFGVLPTAAETDLLIVLGGPMSPNDDLPWIAAERQLIANLLAQQRPIFGACFGAQQIASVLGAPVTTATAKEVGWAPVYRQTDVLPDLPATLTALHWHGEMFGLPEGAQLLFTSDLVHNQGFIYHQNVVGLQFHFEPLPDNLREIVINDAAYTAGSALNQTPQAILDHGVPPENEAVMHQILDFITTH
jgi:GMP synthase-like glutamine amidotransferase